MPIGDEIRGVLEKLPNDPTLKQISDGAPFVGGIIKIAISVTEKVYEAKVPPQKRLPFTIMRIMLKSAKDSLPYFVSNLKVEEFFGNKGSSDEFENIVIELFDPKYNQGDIVGEGNKVVTELRDHPVFTKFRNLLTNGVQTYNSKHEYNKISIPLFLTEFNSNLAIRLEEEKANNKDLENLLHKWKTHKDFENLQYYLKNAKSLFVEPKEIEGKSLSDYYVKNKTYTVAKGTWDYDEKDIIEKTEWTLDSFLTGRNSIVVIAAPFGIGKSSLAKKIAHECAIKFIENPTDPSAYSPIFVELKYALEATSNGDSLENDLERITSYSSRKENTNILVILDGLDELPADKSISIHNIYTTIQQQFIKGFPNRKFIITTRLEAGFPTKLNIQDSYIRLFSFDKEQIKQFFRIYGLAADFDSLSNMLTEQKLGKPLFCWMIATVYNKSSDEEREFLFDYSKTHNLGETFLYQRFIHGVIMGKLKEQFEESFNKSQDEKRALRLIAFLKNEKPLISRSKIVSHLESLKYTLPRSSESLISTYFSTSRDRQGTQKLEFIHKSFQEYLLAEFYLESIFNGNYYRLIGNEPSQETYDHMGGLIKFVTSNDQKIMKYAEKFVRTFYDEEGDFKLKDFTKTLKSNSLRFIKQQDLLPSLPPKNEVEIWNFSRLEYNDLQKIWVSRWLSTYIAGNLIKETESPDNEFLESSNFFIRNARFFIKTKILSSVNLRNSDLYGASLPFANLSDANLSNANLSYADLSCADLSNANLSYANLSYAKLDAADLSNANLSNANLSNANLPYTNLYGANLNVANLSYAKLDVANLSNANLSNANLSNANLSNANLSQSLLINIRSYWNLELGEKPRLDSLLTDMPDLIQYLKSPNYMTEVPPRLVENKQELTNELKVRNYSDDSIRIIVENSKLTQ